MWTWLTISFLVVFAAVLLAIGLAWGWMQARRNARFSERVKAASRRREPQKTTILHSAVDKEELPHRVMGESAYGALQNTLDQAGTTWTPGALMFLTVALAATGVLIGLVVPPLGPRWLTMLVLGAGLGIVPYVWLVFARKRRLAAFEEQFPDALDFLARAMRAGHAFSVGLELLPDESIDPISQEFRRVYHEQNLGAPLEMALKDLALRIPSVDVKFFVAAVLVQRETGGNLSEILLQLASVIRERFELKLQVRAASAHGRLTGIVLSVLPFVLIFALLLVAPGYLQGFFKDSTGRYLVAGALIGQFIGYFFIRRIVYIKV